MESLTYLSRMLTVEQLKDKIYVSSMFQSTPRLFKNKFTLLK
ncbi:7856_t:CDS:1, partial [Funneliformis mosseae]